MDRFFFLFLLFSFTGFASEASFESEEKMNEEEIRQEDSLEAKMGHCFFKKGNIPTNYLGTSQQEEEKNEERRKNFLQARTGYFFFKDTDARAIYHGTIDLELEENYYFFPRYSLWTNLNFIWKSGKTEIFSSHTFIHITTLSIGVKEFFPLKLDIIKLYLGLGITGAYIRVKDQTSYLPKKTIRFSPGCVAKFGLLSHLSDHVLCDLFFDYYYQPTRTRNSILTKSYIDLGGFRTGIGLGYLF